MKIEDLQVKQELNRNRISVSVSWEDCDQPAKEVFIETDSQYKLSANSIPHAFLVGCLVPALHFGEKRIKIDADISPDLLEGLETIMAIMTIWSQGKYKPLTVESGIQKTLQKRDNKGRAAMLYSGGIDSLAALRLNRLHFGKDHPGYIRDCLFIHGFDIGGVVERGMKYHVFDRAVDAMKNVTEDAVAISIPAYTNIRHLCDNRDLWLNYFFGAVLSAVAHAFDNRIDLFYIASSYDLNNLVPCGSHPLLDPEYSSSYLKIKHRDVALTRMEKLKIVSEWGPGLQNMRVCLANVQERLNCGICEKCVRTMTGLLALNSLHKTQAFVEDDVTPEMFAGFKITIRHREPFYQEMIKPLQEIGRLDLVSTIELKLAEKQ